MTREVMAGSNVYGQHETGRKAVRQTTENGKRPVRNDRAVGHSKKNLISSYTKWAVLLFV